MGFLDVLKFKKSKLEFPTEDELDMPPLPPNAQNLPDFDSEFDEEPEVKEDESYLNTDTKSPMPRFETPTEDEIPMPVPTQEYSPQPYPQQSYQPYTQESVQELEDKVVAQQSVQDYGTGPLFVKVDTYKEINNTLNQVRIDLKRSEDEINMLLDVKSNREREFEKWRASLEDIQRKLLFADKTMFKR